MKMYHRYDSYDSNERSVTRSEYSIKYAQRIQKPLYLCIVQMRDIHENQP